MSFWEDIFGEDTPAPTPTAPDPRFDIIMADQRAAAAEDRAFKQQMFEWGSGVYEENKGVTDDIVSRSMDTADRAVGYGADDRAFYEENYQPLQQRVIDDAMGLDSEDQMIRNRGRAVAAVTDQFQASKDNAIRSLEGFGVNPGALRYAGLDSNWRMAEAAAKAGAANQSDFATEAAGRAARQGAVAVGEQGATRALQSNQLALSGDATAGNMKLAQTASGSNIMGNPVQWGSLENQANTGATATLSGQHEAQIGHDKVNMAQYEIDKKYPESSGLGSALGLAAGIGMKAYGLADGGMPDESMAPGMGGAMGGPVPAQASPSGGKAIDDVPAQLNVGEFVVPADVTRWFGEKYFQGLIDKAREAKQSSGTNKPKMKQAVPSEPTYRSDARQALPVG